VSGHLHRHALGNAGAALDYLEACRPFVIVLDLEMPVMDGRSFRLAQRDLPEALRSIPVIICTGSDGIEGIAAELEPLASLSKPLLTFEPLLQHVDAARRFDTAAIEP
jgi:CheY-like chemotaxis protein